MFNVSAQHPGTRALLQKGSRSPHWDPLSVLEAAKELVSDLFRKDPGPRSGSFMPDVDAALRVIANSKVEQDLRFLETPWRAVHQAQQAALGVPYRAANQWMDRPAGGPTPRASQGPTQGSIPGAAQSSGFGNDASELIFGGRPSISSQSDIDKFIHAKDEDIASLSSDFRRKSPAWARTDLNAHLDWLTDFSKLVTRWANDKATVSSNASRFQNRPVEAGKMLLASPIWAKDHGSFQDLWTRLRKVPEPAEAHAASHPQAPSQSSPPRQPQPQQQDPDPPQGGPKDKKEPGLLDNPLAVAVIAITLGIVTFALVSRRTHDVIVMKDPSP